MIHNLFSALDDGEMDVSRSKKSSISNEEIDDNLDKDELNSEHSDEAFLVEEENESVVSDQFVQNSDNENENINKTEKPKSSNKQKKSQALAKFDANLLLLAKKAKMKTVLKKQIFCTIMSSTVII